MKLADLRGKPAKKMWLLSCDDLPNINHAGYSAVCGCQMSGRIFSNICICCTAEIETIHAPTPMASIHAFHLSNRILPAQCSPRTRHSLPTGGPDYALSTL